MKIPSYHSHRNFGHDLNAWMWPRLIDGFFDDKEDNLFLGNGSILGEAHDPAATKIVFGSAFVPEYHPVAPKLDGAGWKVYFVRGPRTARLLDLDQRLAVGDPSILVRTLVDPKRKAPAFVSFMPHWQSAANGRWRKACQLAGLTLIDPRDPVEDIIAALLRSKVVLAEALHGAIVADALRIPWIPMMPIDPIHRGKWYDWAYALKIDLRQNRLLPSSLDEARASMSRNPYRTWAAGLVGSSPVAGVFDTATLHRAARRLEKLAMLPPCMSHDREIERVTAIMRGKVQNLQADYPR